MTKQKRLVIKVAKHFNYTQRQMAKMVGRTPESFCNRLQRGSFGLEEMQEMLKVWGCKSNFIVTLPDNKTIEY